MLMLANTTEVTSFNRYMVECEFIGLPVNFSGKMVLIDTWWNVNKKATKAQLLEISFNRYMVECEWFHNIDLAGAHFVLIDTWWNVNFCVLGHFRRCSLVLIDTWWNVNDCQRYCFGCRRHRFNRYMVECE